ncbi:MAG: precorrin-6y C5,15-methyltransferase (decarboxylating) subunit CbiE [Spirulina sp. SIO3F2]|nr:precorrin-6y C5,15-methyltransferase (decarboxylating) subunit CbiE [Spirulina sp. SIO3F2]
MGLGGLATLSKPHQHYLQTATLIAGTPRLLAQMPTTYPAQQLLLNDLYRDLGRVDQAWQAGAKVVILASGDPLFFGVGRLLLKQFPPERLVFHPHLSSVQLAFSRLRVPWQDAQLVSVHGRDLEPLRRLCQQGVSKIAVLTDPINSPSAIAALLAQLHLPHTYKIWVCENLGGEIEQVTQWTLNQLQTQTFASLSVVVLLRQAQSPNPEITDLPCLGLPDDLFLSFPDRPGLITKREIRVAILGELGLQPGQTIWDIGAGTGSVAIEMARLVPDGQIWAIEKTAMGIMLIEQNCQRLGVQNVQAIAGSAPQAFQALPPPDRVFIGGSGGHLTEILTQSWSALLPQGKLVAAFATFEHLTTAWQWCEQQNLQAQLLQLNVARSLPFSGLHRLTPLNPVTLLSVAKQ